MKPSFCLFDIALCMVLSEQTVSEVVDSYQIIALNLLKRLVVLGQRHMDQVIIRKSILYLTGIQILPFGSPQVLELQSSIA